LEEIPKECTAILEALGGPLFDRERQRETEMGKNTLWTYNSEPAIIPTSSSEHSSSAAASFSSFLLQDSSSSSVTLLQQAATAAEGKCSGAHCFRLAFIIMAAVCAVGCCSLPPYSNEQPWPLKHLDPYFSSLPSISSLHDFVMVLLWT
jgi:hypothetical protein